MYVMTLTRIKLGFLRSCTMLIFLIVEKKALNFRF